MKNNIGLFSKIRAYKLTTQVTITLSMFTIFVLSLVAYQIPEFRKNEIISNILLALFTSLLVTVFTLIADIIVIYNNQKREELLVDLHSFGIKHLHRDKFDTLQTLLQDCSHMIWFAGYRLILTCELKKEIAASIMRGANLEAVICPPWSEAFKMVYGTNAKVMDNYFRVFHAINKARKENNKNPNDIHVIFVDKPIFSDTYRVDSNLITGPYMHNRDSEFNRLTAKDFFSYNIFDQSDLYEIVNNEFKTLIEEGKWKLNWDNFEQAYEEIETGDKREAEKIELFLKACDLIENTDN